MKMMVLAIALMMSTQAFAQLSVADTTVTLAFSTAAPSVTTVCAAGCAAYDGVDAKVIMAAKDDAAAYVASNGQLQSAALQRAFELVRSTNANLQISDMDLAEVILNQR